MIRTVFAILLCTVSLGACTYWQDKPRIPDAYVGSKQVDLLDHLGRPDEVVHRGDDTFLTYYWNTVDGEISMEREDVYRGNVAFVQRSLPTQANPLAARCNLVYQVREAQIIGLRREGTACNP